MCCGPRLPVESIVTSTLSAFNFRIVVVLVRSGQTLSITASLEVSFTNRRLQPLSIFCIDICCSRRLSVQTSIVGIGLPDVLRLASVISAFHCPFCMPLNIFGVNASSAATAAAKPSAKTAAILTAWFMAGPPRELKALPQESIQESAHPHVVVVCIGTDQPAAGDLDAGGEVVPVKNAPAGAGDGFADRKFAKAGPG